MQQLAGAAPSVTRHRSALGSWERAWQRPSLPLRGMLSGYTGYWHRMSAPASHRGIPAPTLPLVISFGPAQTIALPHAGTAPVTVSSFLAGLHDRHVVIDAQTHHGIQVDLDPIAAYRLLGQPLRELTAQVIPLDALLGHDAERLVDELATADDWPTRFQLLDRYLVGLLVTDTKPLAEVGRAWDRIVAAHGLVRIADLAAEVGWSQRHLAAKFAEQLGLSPKRMAKLARFDYAATLLSSATGRGLAEIAELAGYYDQAHFTNDVREFTGLSPGHLLARQLPDSGGVFETDPR